MDVKSTIARNAPAGRPNDPVDDATLMRRLGGGDREAGSRLIERHQAMVRRFLLRLTGRQDRADDLAQDTFVRMIRYADRFDPGYSLGTWLLTIARRLSINQGRGEGRMASSDQWDWVPDGQPGPERPVEQQDETERLRRRLDAAMKNLTPAQRQALLLFHQQDLSVQQVAQVMEVPVGTVKSHLHRARAAMRKLLGSMPEDDQP